MEGLSGLSFFFGMAVGIIVGGLGAVVWGAWIQKQQKQPD